MRWRGGRRGSTPYSRCSSSSPVARACHRGLAPPRPGEPSDINFEVQHCVSSRIAFLRSSIAEPLPWSAIQFGSDPIAIVLGEVSHALALRQVLAHEAIGVFVGAAFPRMVRRGEVETRRRRSLEAGGVVGFGFVFDGDGLHMIGLRGGQLLDPGVYPRPGGLPELAPPQISGLL